MLTREKGIEMITSNVISRTFQLKYVDSMATGVVIDVDKRSYLVTARHFANTINGKVEILIRHEGDWKTLTTDLVGHAQGEIDISVLAPEIVLCPPTVPLPADMGGIVYGQDAYFLGYPYGLYGDVGDLNRNFPLPFVKKAIVSCIEDDKDNVQRLYLDGHNNPGFSGGPVVFKGQNERNFNVAGIISGYRYDEQPIYKGNSVLPFTYRDNSGIIIAYGIKHAVDIAKSNPTGAV